MAQAVNPGFLVHLLWKPFAWGQQGASPLGSLSQGFSFFIFLCLFYLVFLSSIPHT